MTPSRSGWLLAVVFLFALTLPGQELGREEPDAKPHARPREVDRPATVPRLIRFAGLLKDVAGKPRTGQVAVQFAIYREERDESALWMETQNVEADEKGQYTVLLGAASPEGVPLDLFATSEQRWLGVRVADPGEFEQPRALLVSVPYALKAGDAETLGGRPASAYQLTRSGEQADAAASGDNPEGAPPKARITKTPPTSLLQTANYIAMFDSGLNTVNSNIYQNASGLIGIGTTSPGGALHIAAGNQKTLISSTANIFGQVQLGNPSGKEASQAFIANLSSFGSPPTSSSGGTFMFVQGTGLYNTLGSQYSVANAAYGNPAFLLDSAGGVAIGGYAGTANSVPPPANGLIVSGRIGIGTQSPAGALHIVGGNQKAMISSTSNNFGQLQIGNPGGKEASQVYIANLSSFGAPATSSSGNSFIFGQGAGLYNTLGSQYSVSNAAYGNPIFLIDSAGGVALGAYAGVANTVPPPANGLIVSGRIGVGTQSPIAPIQIVAGAATALVVDGNVGVGTIGPTEKLEVAGRLKLTGASGGIVFPDGTVQITAGGSGGGGGGGGGGGALTLTQSADLANTARTYNTIYQNTTGKPLFVSVVDHGNGTGTVFARSDANNPPTTIVAAVSAGGGWGRTPHFLVPAGNYYRMTYDTGSTLDHWYEWTLDGGGTGGTPEVGGLVVSRTVPTAVNDYIEIGNFNLASGSHALRLSVTTGDNGFSVAKLYTVAAGYNQTAGAWQTVMPSADSGASSGNDVAVDISVNNAVAALRLRRTAGATATAATIRIESTGQTADVFTATEATGTDSAQLAWYRGSAVVFPDSTVQTTACGSLAFGQPGRVQAFSAFPGKSDVGLAQTPGAADNNVSALVAIVRQQQLQIDQLRAQLNELKAGAKPQ